MAKSLYVVDQFWEYLKHCYKFLNNKTLKIYLFFFLMWTVGMIASAIFPQVIFLKGSLVI